MNAVRGPVDLSDCAREPIHVPGLIQEFGVLLAVPAGRERISQTSMNTDLVFGKEPFDILGQTLTDVLGAANASQIAAVIRSGEWKETNPLKMDVERSGSILRVNAIVHRYDGLDFIELEPVSTEGAEAAARSYHVILRDGRLWGLIAFHHDTPKYLPYELRSACELLGQILSIRIAALEESEASVYKSETNVLQARFLAELPQFSDVPTALVSQSPNLMDFIPSTGAAVCFGDKIVTLGTSPTEDQIRSIKKWTLGRVAAPTFVTDCLKDRVADAASLTGTASGVLGFTVSEAHDFHVFWFRAEQIQVMKWGGEPTKAAEFNGDSMRLSPRKSFEIWKQEVRGKSQAWLKPEIEAAAELRATLMTLLLTKV